MNIFAGVKGVAASRWDYDIKGYFKNQQDALMFIGYDTTRFIAADYASAVTIFGAKAETNFSINQVLQIGSSVEFNRFTPKTGKYLLGITPYNVRLFAKWNGIQNRLTLHPDLIVYGKTPMGYQENGEVAFRPIQPDLSLEADYRITNRFNVFLQTHNMLGAKYYRWYNYPERRWNFLVGLGFIF
jgi:hypothetical protein